jgi:hypothetical protein
MVQRMTGYERSSTTLELYTRRTDDQELILRTLGEADDPDDERPDGTPLPAR